MKSLLTLITSILATSVFAAQSAVYTGEIPRSDTVLFQGVKLDGVKSVSAMFVGSTMDTAYQNALATPWHLTRLKDETGATTNLTVQFQASLGDYTKCVLVSLSQSGEDIIGRAVFAKYYPSKYVYREGNDATANGWANNAYSLCNLVLSDEEDDYLRTTLWWNGDANGEWNNEDTHWLNGEGQSCKWVPGARAVFTNDAVAKISIADAGVAASHLILSGRKITFTGGTLSLKGAAELEMRTGYVRFECPISSTTGFRVLNGMCSEGVMVSGTHKGYVKMFNNVTLADVADVTATQYGGWSGEFVSTAPKAYHLTNNGTDLSAQLQWRAHDYTKCVKVSLKQDGSDVSVRYDNGWYYCVYVNGVRIEGIDALGYDFAANPSGYAAANAYYIKKLWLNARVELAGANTISGLLRADNYATLALVDGGTINGGVCDNALAIPDAILEVKHTRQTFNGKIDTHEKRDQSNEGRYDRIHGALHVKGNVDKAKDGTLTYSGNLPTKENPGPVTIFENADLSGWVAANADFLSNDTTAEEPRPATPFFFYNDGEKVMVQFHRLDNDNSEAKWVVYEFRQDGSNITCKRISAAKHSDKVPNNMNGFANPLDCFGYDAYHLGGNASCSYSCCNLTVTVKNSTDTSVAIGGLDNGLANGVTVDGAVLAATRASSLPRDATNEIFKAIRVKNGGKLFLVRNENSLGSSTVNLTNNSHIFFCRPWGSGSKSKIVAEGGSEIVIACGNPQSSNIAAKFNSHLSNFILNDGSRVRGSGYAVLGGEGTSVASACISATGTSPSSIEQNFALQRRVSGTSNDQMVFDVPDLTGDAQTDLYFNGMLINSEVSGYLAGRPVLKRGAGTLRFGNANTWTDELEIKEGAVLLAAANALNAGINVKFSGGNLAVEGVTTAAGTLNLANDAEITLDGGEVAFADSSAIEWGECALNITGTGRVRFGTNAQALTKEQLANVTLNGRTVRLNSSGYVRSDDGFQVIFR